MLPLLPDAEVLMIDWLVGHDDLAPIHEGRVGTDLDPERPAIRVTRAPQPAADPDEDHPSLQIECWATTQDEASILARSIIACIPDIEGRHAEGVVSGWEVSAGPFYAPDPDTDAPRYLLGIDLLTYPS